MDWNWHGDSLSATVGTDVPNRPTHFNNLKGPGNETDFLGFCINPFSIGPLHYVSSRSDFSFKISEIFVIEKRLPDSPSRGVDKIA